MPVQHPDVAVIVRLKGDSQLIGIQAFGFDEGAKGGDEVIHPMFMSLGSCLISLHCLNPARHFGPPNGEVSDGWPSRKLRTRQEHGVPAIRSTV
jgi:hypothetical protein